MAYRECSVSHSIIYSHIYINPDAVGKFNIVNIFTCMYIHINPSKQLTVCECSVSYSHIYSIPIHQFRRSWQVQYRQYIYMYIYTYQSIKAVGSSRVQLVVLSHIPYTYTSIQTQSASSISSIYIYMYIYTDQTIKGVDGVPRVQLVVILYMVYAYGVPTISRLLKIIGLFCRILSL